MPENSKHKPRLSPSILTADFFALGETLKMFERHPSVGYVHFDVMDGDFVPNIALGAPVIKSLAGKTKLPFDIHLMVTEPGRYVADFVTENTEYIVVHAEAAVHLDRTLRLIKSLGVKCGAALKAPRSTRRRRRRPLTTFWAWSTRCWS